MPYLLRGGVCKGWSALPPPSNHVSFASAAQRVHRVTRASARAAAVNSGDTARGLPVSYLNQGSEWRSR
eukprot:7941590-Pyramimonas_sp.AAC.1